MAKGQTAGGNWLMEKVEALIGRVSKVESDVSKQNSDIAPKTEWCIGLTLSGEKIYQTRVSLYPEMTDSIEYVENKIEHGVPNIKEVLSAQTGFYRSLDTCFWPLPYIHTSNNEVMTWCDTVTTKHIKIRNRANWEGYHLFVILTYTKTTG